ncbi:MAG: hypothetical protein ASARMPRED_008263 [Alectoria sarmentosa]|nr:MAG: hypothetical protein ASARMPRED_008263 [Alectoria sarmentosa]
MHQTIDPAILYWGSAVIIISTKNPDGTTNLAPMSSAWWLGQRCMLGLAAESQTTINLRQTKQCVLNLPSDTMVSKVNALAKTTSRQDMSPFMTAAGYRYVKDKFKVAQLTPMWSEMVQPSRILECPVQMEAELVAVNEMNQDEEGREGSFLALEVKVLRIHADENILQVGEPNKVNADRWRPLMHVFQHFYGLSARLQPSRLAEIDEEKYR